MVSRFINKTGGADKYSLFGGALFELVLIQLVIVTIAVVTHVTISSYGLIISNITGSNSGLIFGEPTPIRSDEYAVLTPLIQTTVLSGYKAFNGISLFGESLLGPFAMPIVDWALFFKPQFWLFWISPEIGLSYYHLFFISISIWGWYRLFRDVLGCRSLLSLLASGCIFTSPFLQYVFTTHGQSFAFLPVLLWLIFSDSFSRLRSIRLIASFYVAACLTISDFYPPYFLQYIIVVGVLLCVLSVRKADPNYAFRPDRLIAYSGAALGVGIAAIYLSNVIVLLSELPFSANARFQWGHEPPLRKLAELMPSFGFYLRSSFIGPNAVEGSAMGSLLLLPVLSTMLIHKFKQRAELFVFLTAYVLISLWQITPLGYLIEHVPILNKLSASRSFLLTGVLSIMLSFLAIEYALQEKRYAKSLYLVLPIIGCLLAIKAALFGLHSILIEATLLVLGLPILQVLWSIKYLESSRYILPLGLIVLIQNYPGALVNPIQRADDIFDLQNHQATAFYSAAALTKNGIILDTNLMGGVWSGLGQKSYSHVIPLPDVPKLTPIFQQILGENEFDAGLLQKWLHIKVALGLPTPLAETFADAVSIGGSFIDDTFPNFYLNSGSLIEPEGLSKSSTDLMFASDQVNFKDGVYCVSGWAFDSSKESMISVSSRFRPITILADGVVISQATVETLQRWDVARTFNKGEGMFSGFKVCSTTQFNQLVFGLGANSVYLDI